MSDVKLQATGTGKEELKTIEPGKNTEVEKDGDRGKTVRIQLLLPQKSADRLDALKGMTEAASASEVIRNAIRVYEALVKKEVKDHAKILIQEHDGTLAQIRIF